MMLSNVDIFREQKKHKMIEPFNTKNIQPNSYDLTLSNEFMRFVKKDKAIELHNETEYEKVISDKFIVHSKELILATTKEEIYIPNKIGGQLEGRSSIGRLGLFIHNAGLIDSGYRGQITLEIYNASVNDVVLLKDARIAQIVLSYLNTPTNKPYNGKYQGQKGVTGSMLYKDFDDNTSKIYKSLTEEEKENIHSYLKKMQQYNTIESFKIHEEWFLVYGETEMCKVTYVINSCKDDFKKAVEEKINSLANQNQITIEFR